MEPIAIVGLGCRFPGAPDLASFWRLLRDGGDAISEVPPERWDIDAFYDPDPDAPGKMSTRWGGFLTDVDRFDADFFGIPPREAERTDPQQRLVLEVAWEALENAGLAPDRLSGSSTGVFIGISHCDYARILFRHAARISAYNGAGSYTSIASNRLSYLLNLRGPSMAIDTACSSSLSAVHLACQHLRQRECRIALAGGVNLNLTPDETIALSKARMMAADGRCKTFDARADGYVRGEGCGVVVLKRVEDALRDGDRIRAVIRGSAANQDGLSNGLTAPNGPAQQELVQRALENAGVAPAQIGYVEAHGTGTSLGDPIEVKALRSALARGRGPEDRCWIASVKTNIGHLEAAAGIAGLIKAVLALEHEAVPPHLHLQRLNPLVVLGLFSIPTTCQPWPRGPQPRLAGVSSFGFGGSNCHVVIEEAPARSTTISAVDGAAHLFTLRAKSEPALRELAQRDAAYFQAHPETALADACFTSNTGRSVFDHRLAVVARTSSQLSAALDAFAAGKEAAELVHGKAPGRKRPKVGFLFTGQGSQYAGMGRGLFATQPVFREAIERCDALLRVSLQRPLLEVLYPAPGAESPLNQTAYAQPALFALEYALAQLWRSWGVEPTWVLGHSVGEYVAACVAGAFSLEDGLRLVAERGRLMQQLPLGGAMAAVRADEERVRAALARGGQPVSIAALNGPGQVVISGAAGAVAAVLADLKHDGILAQPLSVSHAFHSALMEPMIEPFRRVAQTVQSGPLRIALVSNLGGRVVGRGEVLDADYWAGHVRAGRFCGRGTGAGRAELRSVGGNWAQSRAAGPGAALLARKRRAGLAAVAAARTGRLPVDPREPRHAVRARGRGGLVSGRRRPATRAARAADVSISAAAPLAGRGPEHAVQRRPARAPTAGTTGPLARSHHLRNSGRGGQPGIPGRASRLWHRGRAGGRVRRDGPDGGRGAVRDRAIRRRAT